jgi:phenylpropionate dioxygenase-like ring-hydroxylating dioxygenase large terminal subunit
MCTYHGWTYDLKGSLVGVPGFKDYYHEDLNREEWGLVRAAQVDSYKGFIFATLDPEAPSFYDYLGEVGRLSIDSLAEKADEIVVADGIQKYTIGCNWKFAADNVWDFYHSITHTSSVLANWQPDPRYKSNVATPTNPYMNFLGEYGHAYGGPENNPLNANSVLRDQSWRQRPEARRVIGPLIDRLPTSHPNIFPNFWITGPGFGQVSMRMPKGPMQTEIWWFTFLDKNAAEKKQANLQQAIHTFGPAGMLEQEDGENWDQSTRGTVGTVARRFPLNYQMNLGRGEIIEDELSPPRIELNSTSEHPQLWHYRNWAQWMAADSWAELKANHPIARGTV